MGHTGEGVTAAIQLPTFLASRGLSGSKRVAEPPTRLALFLPVLDRLYAFAGRGHETLLRIWMKSGPLFCESGRRL